MLNGRVVRPVEPDCLLAPTKRTQPRPWLQPRMRENTRDWKPALNEVLQELIRRRGAEQRRIFNASAQEGLQGEFSNLADERGSFVPTRPRTETQVKINVDVVGLSRCPDRQPQRFPSKISVYSEVERPLRAERSVI